MWDLSPLGAGWPPKVAYRVAMPTGMLSMGSGEGCHLLDSGDCLGTSEGETVVVGCPSVGEVLCGEMSGVMEVFAQVRGGTRQPECFQVVVDCCTRQTDKW